MKTLRISKKQLGTIASFSLQGIALSEGLIPNDEMKLQVLFEQSTLAWKQENNGPDFLLLPEHVILCLCESIVALSVQGYKVEIGEYNP